MSAANIDVITESALWDALPDAEQIVRNAVTQAAAALDRQADAELAVLLTDDAAIQRLNATWRGLDKPTNVLSFPSAVTPESQHLGDIARLRLGIFVRDIADVEDDVGLDHLLQRGAERRHQHGRQIGDEADRIREDDPRAVWQVD